MSKAMKTQQSRLPMPWKSMGMDREEDPGKLGITQFLGVSMNIDSVKMTLLIVVNVDMVTTIRPR